MRLEEIDFSTWGTALPNTGFEPFHTPEALRVLDAHTSDDLRLYAGFNGDRPVALLPLFVRSMRVGTVLSSPPPEMGVSRLGPLVMPASPKRRKREKLNGEFASLVLDETDADARTTLLRVLTGSGYGDPRPFVWNGFDVETFWTYRLDTAETTADALLTAASKSLRREIRDASELDITIDREGVKGAKAVYDETRSRYAEQGRELPMSWPYVRDLVEALSDVDRARVYVARDSEGRFLSGITVLYSNDAGYFWQGGTRSVYEGVAVNSLLHWRVIEDIVDDPPRESVSAYDLQGANTERLCQYKSKFGAELVPYYLVETSGASMTAAKRAYELVAR